MYLYIYSHNFILYTLAKSLAELGQIENAKIEYYKAMNLTPEHAGPMPEATVAYCNLLIKYAKSKADLEEAAEYLEMMIDQGTYQMYQTVEQINIEDIYDRLCICLEKLGRNDDALDRMLNLCKIKPNSHQIHFETGRFAIMCKEYDLAKEHLEFAVSLEPFDMYAKYHLALALFYMGDEESINKSKFEVLKILENKPNDEKCQDLLAKIHIAQNNWNDALKIYETQNAKGNTRAYLQYQIGVAYENLNNEDSAIAAFENSADKWLKYVKQIGYDKYFYQRPKEMKALQKIQSRCVKHGNDQKWSNLKGIVDQIGQY